MSGRRGDALLRGFEKYLADPLFRALLRWGISPRAFALLETTGRRTGSVRQVPVGNGLQGSTFWLVSMRGDSCNYVRNLTDQPRVRVKVGRTWYEGTAVPLEHDDAVARRRRLDKVNGVIGRMDGLFFRLVARNPMTVRIDLTPGP